MTKHTLQNIGFGTTNFVKIANQSLYKVKSFTCCRANRDKPVAATLQRKYLGGITFAMTTKMITKKYSKDLFCNNFGQDVTELRFWDWPRSHEF